MKQEENQIVHTKNKAFPFRHKKLDACFLSNKT